jgi:uncharacterized protein YdaT
MPWNENDYPASMRNLPREVRSKAIDIANALLQEGVEEGKAIRIAIAKTRQWAQHHRRDWANCAGHAPAKAETASETGG